MFEAEAALVDDYLKNYFDQRLANIEQSQNRGLSQLFESVRYSVFSGGKRFRPILAVLTAKSLSRPSETVLPMAAAVECIHTYSLIHDDLPIMDDDDDRRGQPTNHKVYGEATALLAGDALLTEAFLILANGYAEKPEVVQKVVNLLAKASGVTGMVGGQAIDLEALKNSTPSEKELNWIHQWKTGALIAVAVEGAAVVCQATEDQTQQLRQYGEALGLAFQLADDILDFDPNNPEESGFPAVLGLEKTNAFLGQASDQALSAINSFGQEAEGLRKMIQYNLTRAH